MSIIRLTDDLRAIGYDGLRTVADNVLTDPVLNETLEDAANDSKRMEVILNLLMRLSKPQFIQLIECIKVLIAGENSIISSLCIYTVEPEVPARLGISVAVVSLGKKLYSHCLSLLCGRTAVAEHKSLNEKKN